MANCTNPKAVNYDPAATADGDCIYLRKIDGVCYAFEDLDPGELVDKSFTLSWSLLGDNWVFYHDYIPDYYIHVRERFFSLKDSQIFEHHTGPMGKYYNEDINAFFIDVVLKANGEGTLDTVNWLTEVINTDGTVARQETLTHITVWNSRQCTGRIPISTIFKDLANETSRESRGFWSFNDFRDKVETEGSAFLQDLFHNFAVVDLALSDSLPWFEQQLLEDNYFVARFEFDNTPNKKIFIHETGAQISPSFR